MHDRLPLYPGPIGRWQPGTHQAAIRPSQLRILVGEDLVGEGVVLGCKALQLTGFTKCESLTG